MRAVVFAGSHSVRVDEVPEPRLQDAGDAIVRVDLAAICGSDLHVYEGKLAVEAGDLLGHEAVGVVEEVGPAVTGVQAGDRVVVAFSNVCGRCWYCTRGQTALCKALRMLGFGKAREGLDGCRPSGPGSPGPT